MSTQEILILGANFGGVAVAHYLLNNTIPALTSLDSSKSYHVTLVGPATSFYYKISVPRVIASPELISLKQVSLPFLDGFKKHDASAFTFVQGLATGVDEASKSVTVQLHDKSTTSLAYNTLVIATGTTSGPLWTINDDLTATNAAHAQVQKALPHAKTILIAGGGPAGTETAGEIADKYKNAKVTILSGSDRLLPRLAPATSSRADAILKKLGVTVINNVRVTSATTSADGSSTTLKFDDGSEKVVDLYIPATGGKPNTAFLPPSWVDSNGKLAVDYGTLRATAAKGVYGIGDAASYSMGTYIDLSNGIHPVVSAIGQDLAAQLTAAGAKAKAKKLPAMKERNYKPMKDTQLVPIGRSQGVGQLMGYRIPSKFVWFMKGRTFFIEKAKPATFGKEYVKP